MFSKTLVDSDDFLNLPTTAQLLYFHLNIRADDDGFINNVKSITRYIGCNTNDFDALVNNGYIILFDSGICCIKHWKVHNYIRADRYHPSACSERDLIVVDDESGVYELVNQSGDNMDTEDTDRNRAKDKVSLSKFKVSGSGSKGKAKRQIRTKAEMLRNDGITSESIESTTTNEKSAIVENYVENSENTVLSVEKYVENPMTVESFVENYNKYCKDFPKVKKLLPTDIERIEWILEVFTVSEITETFRKMATNDFLKGDNNFGWKASFSWIIDKTHFTDIANGKYDSFDNQYTCADLYDMI